MIQQTDWHPMHMIPSEDVVIDVRFRNGTFDPPAEGVIEVASHVDEFWYDHSGAGVPDRYVVAWRRSSQHGVPPGWRRYDRR